MNLDLKQLKNLEQISTFQRSYANKTMSWMGEDNQERFHSLTVNPEQRKILEKNGWLATNVTYQFNSQGFRGHEFDPTGDYFCVFGDSVTFGTALNQEQTYGGLLEKYLGLKCYNFGQAGGSNDTCVRNAMTYLPDLRPKFVIFQTTFDHRFEWIMHGNVAKVYGVQKSGSSQLSHTLGDLFINWIDVDINRSINLVKNRMCFGFICQEMSLPLIEIKITKFFQDSTDRARDLLHPGTKSHHSVAGWLVKKLNQMGCHEKVEIQSG